MKKADKAFIKKLILLFSLFIIISCSKNNNEILLISPTVCSLKIGESLQLETTLEAEFTTSNDFYAQVTNTGMILGMHAGKCEITARSGIQERIVSVEVLPNYTLYNEPCLDFNKTKKEIINMLGKPDIEEGNSIAYFYKQTPASLSTQYIFKGDRLNAVNIFIHSEYFTQIFNNILPERYNYIGYEAPYYTFINAYYAADATLFITFSKQTGYNLYNLTFVPIGK